MIDADLDHVAVAAERQSDLWPRYAGDLGGQWVGGGPSPGFHWAQVIFGNGMRLEALQPYAVEQSDFLRRFLDRNGPGPHHLTFKVPDIADALAQAEASGYRPTGVNLSDPNWKEAFLHPKDAPGVVVQLAESGGDPPTARPGDFPPARITGPASLVHVCHAVTELHEGMRLFADLLGGRESGRGGDDRAEWVDLAWPGAGRIRVVTPRAHRALRAWLGDRAGRVHHLAFAVADPGGAAGAKPVAGEQVWMVEPADNQGTRLLLAEPGADVWRRGPLGHGG